MFLLSHITYTFREFYRRISFKTTNFFLCKSAPCCLVINSVIILRQKCFHCPSYVHSTHGTVAQFGGTVLACDQMSTWQEHGADLLVHTNFTGPRFHQSAILFHQPLFLFLLFRCTVIHTHAHTHTQTCRPLTYSSTLYILKTVKV